MRLIYIIACCGVLGVLALWLGKFKFIQKKLAVFIAAVGVLLAGVLTLLAVLPQNNFYGQVVTSVPTQKKLVALTYDDGPYLPYTLELLKVLQEKQVKATFFMVGENAFQKQEAVRAVSRQGHEIALHAGSHRDLLKLDPEAVAANIDSGKVTLEWLSGKPVKYMRPPHGFRDWAVMEEIHQAGLTAVNWSVIPRDWTNPGTDVIVDRVCSKVFPGAIILLHDGDSPKNAASRQQTVEATAAIIDRLRSEGYEFVTVSQLMASKEEK